MIATTGTHRTGKSTLAQAYAERHGLPYIATSATEVMRALNLETDKDYPIVERVAAQEAILEAFEKQYAEAAEKSLLYVADRTPLDLAAYLLADVRRDTLTGNTAVATVVQDYVKRCIESTNRWFSTVVLVQPGIKIVEAPGKGGTCPAYMLHHNLLIKGLMQEHGLKAANFAIPTRITDLQERIESMEQAVGYAFEKQNSARALMEGQGISYH